MSTLIVDYHAGCIGATALGLRDIGVDVQIVSLSQHQRLLEGLGLQGALVKGMQRQVWLHRLGLAGWPRLTRGGLRVPIAPPVNAVKTKPRKFAGRPKYRVAFVHFPPALYRPVLLSGIAEQVVLIVSHRFDMWYSDPDERRRFHDTIAADIGHGRVIAYAANHFDQAYFRFYTGIDLPRLDPHFPYLQEARKRLAASGPTRPVMFGPAHLSLESEPATSYLEPLLAAPPLGDGLRTIRQTYSHYAFEDLATHAGIVTIPYSIYSISMSELAAIGLPILMPSDDLLLELGVLHDVQLYPHYGRAEEVRRFHAGGAGDPNVELTAEWLAKSSWHDFPNYLPFRSMEEARSMVTEAASADRNRLVTAALAWNSANRERWVAAAKRLALT